MARRPLAKNTVLEVHATTNALYLPKKTETNTYTIRKDNDKDVTKFEFKFDDIRISTIFGVSE